MRRRILRHLGLAVAVSAILTLIAAVGLDNGMLAGFQRRAADSLFPSAATDDRIVVVAVDRTSFNAVGLPWPWPRDLMARLNDQISAADPSVVVYDIVFGTQREGTDALARSLDTVPNVILAESTILSAGRGPFLRMGETQRPVPQLAEGHTVAHAEVTPDPADGVVRTLPLVVEDRRGQLVPGLSLEALREMQGVTGPITVRPDGIQAGKYVIPTEPKSTFRLNFARGLDGAAGRRAVIPAIDVINGTIDPRRLQGKVVLIGVTEQTLRDNQLVPLDKTGGMPGVLIHANALNTMLTSAYLEPASNAQTVVAVAVLTVLVAFMVLSLPIWLAALATAALAAAYLVLALIRFDHGTVLNIVWPMVTTLIAFVVAVTLKYLTETRHRRRVSQLFARYVPEAVAKQLVEGGRAEAAAEGERLDVSLFFCDLRGFTALSTTLTPSQVRAMLNAFYELLTEIIYEHNGTVLKFVGDEVFAVFGAPLPIENHPQVTVECAMEIQRRAGELTEILAPEGITQRLQFGLGMNTGEVVAAHVGATRRRQYDIVGDTVNLGSRLCGQAGKGEIVLTQAMYDLLTDPPPCEAMGAVALKGISQPVPLVKIVVDPETAEARQPAAAAPPVPAEPPAPAPPSATPPSAGPAPSSSPGSADADAEAGAPATAPAPGA